MHESLKNNLLAQKIRLIKLLKPVYLYFRHRPYKNVFSSNHKKRVLISYIPYVFREKHNWYRHSNYQETFVIAKLFDKFGYTVDVYSQLDKSLIDYSQYQVVFGVGYPLEQSFLTNSYSAKRIYYGLGTQMNLHNLLSIERIKDFKSRHALLIASSSRVGNESWPLQTSLVDAIITVGNELTVESYSRVFDGPIYQVPVTFHDVHAFKDISAARTQASKTSYLWFGGSGMVHKGLDLVLDFFLENTDLQLHICGPVSHETEFYNYYKEQIHQSKNVFLHDYVNVQSLAFKSILSQCSFILSPSVAEGQSSSLVTAMALGGLVPIHTERSGILPNKDSIIIHQCEYESLKTAIEDSQKIPYKQLLKKHDRIAQSARKTYSIQSYSSALESALTTILDRD